MTNILNLRPWYEKFKETSKLFKDVDEPKE